MMLGVILWSDASDRKAVIWCEDQGDLAFFNSETDDCFGSDSFFDAGDLVQFEMEVLSTMRRARNPRLVIEQVGTKLPQVLRDRSKAANRPQAAAQIIPIGRRLDRAKEETVFAKSRKKG